MALAPGDLVGPYQVTGLIGAGGMGEVYRARDQRLGRDVAIKILAPRVTADADGVMRFEREARLLASLNHPNIASIYGVEDAGPGQPALVLELVDGETLADRIARGPIPAGEALSYARQIADALDSAHEAGIVHRDLKPANIKITSSGAIKVLDFGLAKAIAAASHDSAADPAQSPTITVAGTHGGIILGTAAYMSPEQARGKTIDKRTDIWAFGCVLFEMLSGRRTFSGETTSDVIAAIIERTPDWSTLPPSLPRHVRRVIERCLEKDPRRRARDIADVHAELDDAAPAPPRRAGARPAATLATAALVLALAGVGAWRWAAPPPADAPIEFTFGAPPGHTLTVFPATVSPDGSHVAFAARDGRQVASLWIRSLTSATPRRLEGTEGTASGGYWSPDGRSLAFLVGNTWKRVDVDGGPVVSIVAGIVANLGLSWGPDDTILMAPANRTGLARVAASGGSLEPATTLDPERENSHRWPHLLPDGRHFLFTVRSDRPETLGIRIGALDSPAVRPLVGMPSPGIYVEPGWLLFMTPDEALMAQRLDRSTWTLDGPPQAVAAPVRYNGPSFSGNFDASRDGRVLTYVPASRSESTLIWFDRAGKPIGRVEAERRYRSLRLSPSGRTIAVELADERYGTRDIWLIDAATQALTRLTSNAATDWRPVFSPDERTLAFASDRVGASTLFRIAANGAGGESVLYRHPKGGVFPADWSRDGRHVLATLDTSDGRPQALISIPVDGGPITTLIENSPSAVTMPRFSPEGDRIAFMSNATGTREVYVMSIADRRRVRVSTDGGWNPKWGPDGRELFFQTTRGEIMRAVLDGTAMVIREPPAVLFRPCAGLEGLVFSDLPAEDIFDVTADGARSLGRCDPPDATPSAVTVILNWQRRLR